MSKTLYALEPGGPKRLEVSYTGIWKDFTIRLDEKVIGMIADVEQLKAGQEFTLDDGSTLKVQLKLTLYVFRNGQRLLSYDPAQHLGYTYKIIFIFGAMNILFWIFGILPHKNHGNLPAGNILSLVLGGLFIVLGFFVVRRSMIALAIAAGIVAVDLILIPFFPPNLPRLALILGAIFRVLVLLGMIQGFSAIKALRRSRQIIPVS